jgi:hypothetical protein
MSMAESQDDVTAADASDLPFVDELELEIAGEHARDDQCSRG